MKGKTHFVDGMKPCPFCGGKKLYWDKVIIDEAGHYFLMCKECGCEGPYSELQDAAAMLWDIRQPL